MEETHYPTYMPTNYFDLALSPPDVVAGMLSASQSKPAYNPSPDVPQQPDSEGQIGGCSPDCQDREPMEPHGMPGLLPWTFHCCLNSRNLSSSVNALGLNALGKSCLFAKTNKTTFAKSASLSMLSSSLRAVIVQQNHVWAWVGPIICMQQMAIYPDLLGYGPCLHYQ